MTLTQITKVRGPGIHTQSNIVSNSVSLGGIATASNFKTGTSNLHNVGLEIAGINVLGADTPIGTGATIYDAGGAVFTGVVTATSFSGSIAGTASLASGLTGTPDIAVRNITGVGATFTGNVSIGGTLTYEDVTNIDSVGIITARDGIDCNGDLDVDGHTNLDNVSVAGVSTFTVGTNKSVQIYAATHNDETNLGAGIGFSRQSDGATPLSGIFGHSNTGLGVAARDHITFLTGGSSLVNDTEERLRIASDGKVGIGTNNPTGTLTIASGTFQSTTPTSTGDDIVISGNNSLGMQFLTLASNTSNNNIYFGDTDDPDVGMIRYAHANNSLQFQTNTEERLRITGTGQFHMGGGSSWTYANQKFVVVEGSNPLGMLLQGNNANQGVNLTLQNINNNINAYSDLSFADDGGQIFGAVRGRVIDRDNNHGEIHFHTSDGTLRERLRIDKDGILWANYGNPVSSSLMILDKDGSGEAQLRFYNAGSNKAQIALDSSEELTFDVNGDERLRINSDGDVLISHTTTPSADIKLLVGGNAGVTDGKYFSFRGGYGNTAEPAAHAIKFDSTIGASGGLHYYGYGGMNFDLGGQERIKFTQAGKVLIGVGVTDYGSLNVDGAASFGDNGTNAGIIIGTDGVSGAALHCLTTGSFQNGSYSNMRFNALSHKFTYGNNTRLEINSSGKAIFAEEIETPQDYPNYQPTLDLNFAAVKKLDSRIRYSRNGVASYIDEYGYLKFASDNVPRFDHDPDTGECLGLLIEDSRTNILNNTGGTGVPGQVPANGANLGNSPTQTVVNDVILPTGKPGSVKRVRFSSAGNSGLRFGWTSGGSANNPYSASVWARATTGTASLTIDVNDQDNNTYTLTTEWVRMKSTGTMNQAYRFMDLMGGASADVYIWGYQIEQNDHVSSYMPNDYPRGADEVIIEGKEFTDFFNPIEGTSVVHAHMPSSSGNSGLPSYAFKNSAVSQHTLQFSRDGNANPVYHYYHDGSNTAFTRASATADNMYKGAMSFKTGDLDSYVNGTANANTTSFTMPAFDNLRIGGVGGANQLGGHVARFMYYPVKLTNSQLITLTS